MARRFSRFGAGALVATLAAAGLTLSSTTAASATDWGSCLEGSDDTQAVFARAAQVSGVPEDVLLGVGYLGGRWSQHAGQPSVSGGYGVMHLTDAPVVPVTAPEKGDSTSGLPSRAGTLHVARQRTGLSAERLRTDPVANICGAAAVLASYQPGATEQDAAGWSKAVARYAGTADRKEALHYAGLVFDVLRSGATETTDLGDTVTLAAQPGATLDTSAVVEDRVLQPGVQELECPSTVECDVVEAQYRSTGPSPTQYVNYDLADREKDLSIDYLVVHNTECTYDVCTRLIKGEAEPNRFVSWHYTVRSSDGHVDQHVATRNVAAHAGNWYLNMHSVGVEHEGKAGEPGTWYTEALYRSSAQLVSHLAEQKGIELDRAHIVGHEEFMSSNYKWDPGPYWDWEHYMDLLGAPIRPDRRSGPSQVFTVKPGFTDNARILDGCFATETQPGRACPSFGTNYVDVRTAPSDSAPLVWGSTDLVSDRDARAVAGHKFSVAGRQGDWLKVWWDGSVGWIKSPKGEKATVVPSQGEVVEAVRPSVPVYARAYPEAAAYAGTPVPYQGQPTVTAPDGSVLTLEPGQRYVVADRTVPTDYFYAKSFDNSIRGDKSVITGDQEYVQVWVGHRFGYVKAEDVRVLSGR
ncbi:N-acetylmuramoyl-L-alanine amidase [Knoellia sp. CPCC 206450]|uniref:N-acetylmuramoyl-L-alanine amidase n=1 Tax=Knoellia tibetensis TaxID=3404798 RepID=UPI003B435EDC